MTLLWLLVLLLLLVTCVVVMMSDHVVVDYVVTVVNIYIRYGCVAADAVNSIVVVVTTLFG